MSILPINSLAQMEYALYGARAGMNANCPSYINGYVGNINYNMPYFSGYNYYYNPAFHGNYNNMYNNYNQNIGYQGLGYPQNYNYAQNRAYQTQNPQNMQFKQRLTQEDINNLADYYANNNVLDEGFIGAATGGLGWMAWEHAQTLFHPINGYKGLKKAEELFKIVPKEFLKENQVLCQDAYTAIQQATRDTGSKWFYSGWLRKPIDKTAIEPLLENMKNALTSGDPEAIAKATQELQAARGMDGKLVRWFSKPKTVAERLSKNADNIKSGTQNLVNISKGSFTELLKSTFKKDFIGFMAFETLFNIGKIFTAFKKDTDTGIKQTGQSVGKSALGAAGWCVGRAAGAWAGAEVGKWVGTAICPGAGTIAGAIIGFTLGSIGMWAGHKIGNALLGKDVADKIDAKKMTESAEGQTQLLQFAMEKAKEGKLDAKTQEILNKINVYA